MRLLFVFLLAACSAPETEPDSPVACQFDAGGDVRLPRSSPLRRLRSIMAIGDSISADGEMGTPGAWRPYALQTLVAAGFSPGFVGPQESTSIEDGDHSLWPSAYSCAISGKRISNIVYHDGRPNPIAASGWGIPGPLDAANGSSGSPDLSSAFHMDYYSKIFLPNLRTLMLGTNDIVNNIPLWYSDGVVADGSAVNTAQEMANLIDYLTSVDPSPILVSSIPQNAESNGSGGTQPLPPTDPIIIKINGYNALLATVCAARAPQVFFVDGVAGFDYTSMIQLDFLHPNALGMQLIGNNIGAAIAARTDLFAP